MAMEKCERCGYQMTGEEWLALLYCRNCENPDGTDRKILSDADIEHHDEEDK